MTVQKKHSVITIDGPAGSGKSTVAKLVADRLGFAFLDTGAIYRALAFLAQTSQISWDDEDKLAQLAANLKIEFKRIHGTNRIFVNNQDISEQIRTPQISQGASQVSRHPKVRQTLLKFQREFANHNSLVAEGRDTGSVVFPNASTKIFLNASVHVRAERRYKELLASGHNVQLEKIQKEVEERDVRDSTRKVAPLCPAPDAIVIDTSDMNIDQVVEKIIGLCVKPP